MLKFILFIDPIKNPLLWFLEEQVVNVDATKVDVVVGVVTHRCSIISIVVHIVGGGAVIVSGSITVVVAGVGRE